jgi:tRNA A-37 threonylcarbamoyl transferase component Bud32
MDGSDTLTRVVRAATGRSDATIATIARRTIAAVDNMTTETIERLSGTLADGTDFSVVAKTLRPIAHAPEFAAIPDQLQPMVAATLDWRDEPAIWASGLADELPSGLRLPRLYEIEERDERITIWMEDVGDRTAWTLDRYERTARRLGQLAGRWPGDRATVGLGIGPRDIGTIFYGKVMHRDLPIQSDDAFWEHPRISAAVDPSYRSDLFRLAELMPAMIERLDTLPSALCHGDACPANFLEPGDGTVVAIDWSYGHAGNPGSDLGQLLAGRFVSAPAEDDDLETVAACIFGGYLEGLADEGAVVSEHDVEQAWATHLALRSSFMVLTDGMPPHLDETEHDAVLRSRARLGRFGLDLALRHAVAGI